MIDRLTPNHACIILDACCLINLYGSGRIADLLSSLHQEVAVAAYVRSAGVLTVRRETATGAKPAYEAIDLQPVIDQGLLQVVNPESDAEMNSFADFAAALQDDGESITAAIAMHRRWAIGTDDRKASGLFRRELPHIQVVSTPEMLKRWADRAGPSAAEVRTTLRKVRFRARYLPSRGHLLRGWWDQFA